MNYSQAMEVFVNLYPPLFAFPSLVEQNVWPKGDIEETLWDTFITGYSPHNVFDGFQHLSMLGTVISIAGLTEQSDLTDFLN